MECLFKSWKCHEQESPTVYKEKSLHSAYVFSINMWFENLASYKKIREKIKKYLKMNREKNA